MQVVAPDRKRISGARLRWLAEQCATWRDEGIVDEATGRQILARYDAEPDERRAMVAIVLLAVAMCGFGVLFLVGYNWHRIAPAGKVAILFASVAGAFLTSAMAFAKNRPGAGETLAFAGTILFGTSIWQIAQVLHISGHPPDAFLWFAIGALAVTYLVGSRWIAAGGALLLGLWSFMHATSAPSPWSVFLLLYPATFALAYRLRSPETAGLAAFGAAVWVFATTVVASDGQAWAGPVVLTACAFYAIARWHRANPGMQFAWHVTGLLVLLVALVPLMIVGFHREMKGDNLPVVSLVIAAVSGLAAFSIALRRPGVPSDGGIVAVAVGACMWTAAGTLLTGNPTAARASAGLFSVLALVMMASLVRTALRTGRVVDLGSGLAFGLVFLIVRWQGAMENLFWSGLLLLAGGGGLLLVAKLWRRRDRRAPMGTPS